MARGRILPGGVVDTAIVLIDREGFEALSLSAVAEVLRVRPSALYGHVGGLDQLRDRIAVTATNHLTSAVGAAAMGVAGSNALDAIGHAYRGFAHGHPGQYSAILRPASPTNIDSRRPTRRCTTSSPGSVSAPDWAPMRPTSPPATPAAPSTGSSRSNTPAGRRPATTAATAHLLRLLHRDLRRG